MIDRDSSLEDVCFAVAQALDARGITAVLTGGSAAALYAPHAYMSLDADFVVDVGRHINDVASALEPTGFTRVGKGRIFTHALTTYTIDFPKGPLAVGGDYITATSQMRRKGVSLRLLTRTDCIRDRLAHFYFWDDYTALHAAVGVAAVAGADVDVIALRQWTKREGDEYLSKFEEFERRVKAALDT